MNATFRLLALFSRPGLIFGLIPGLASGLAPRLVPGLVLTLTLGGCNLLNVSDPLPPEVSISRIEPLNFSLDQQKLAVRLDVRNPNNFDLPLRSLDLVARFADTAFITGRSSGGVTLPAKGRASLDLELDAALGDLIDFMRDFVASGQTELPYTLEGSVTLGNWPSPFPLQSQGMIENPLQ